ncbi:MAG: hypothetical protein HZA17_11645 [Nitrospirae bacterium]|nr:hypothetical protein [Nitrospirota bacterium]
MQIEDLRKIGEVLIKGLSEGLNSPERKTAIGIGAAGDKTFPIDRKAEEIIIAGLEALDEPLTIISEEAGVLHLKGGGRRVLIDPIDGSKNAVSGIPFYSASLAVADGDTLADVNLSYVLNLVSGDEFWAEKDRGSFLNGNRIHSQEDEEFFMIAFEAQVPARDLPEILPLLSGGKKARCFGSTALDLSYLASGSISVFICPSPSRSFDYAGGWLLVREAGGVMTAADGREIGNILLGLERSVSLLASGNAGLHQKALALLRKKKDVV